MAEALYRKYRPQIFEDVVGQEHIERTLKNAIEQDKVSHAYLFCGPRGTGKTTTARLLAKALLCADGPTAEPDGTCENCLAVANGTHPDVYELDAASRTGVENVREEIIGRVDFAPTSGRYKVYIIDEVHMLSTAAFNALLKTLEEPPSHVVFILCTTDPQKVPETIHSRCQRFDFHRISAEAIVSRLGAICMAEEVEFDGDALDLIAYRAEGGMRNALTSLEQLIAFGEGKVTLETAERLLGSVDSSDMNEIVSAIGARDVAACFKWVADFSETGADLAQFVRDLAEHFRNMYVLTLAGDDTVLEVSEAVRRELTTELPQFGPERLARILGVLGDLSSELRTAMNPRMSFEIALTRLVRPESDLTLESLAERVEALEAGQAATSTVQQAQGVETPPPAAPPSEAAPLVEEPGAPVREPAGQQAPSPLQEEGEAQSPQTPAEACAPSEPAPQSAALCEPGVTGLANPATLQRIWQSTLQSIKKEKAAYAVLFLNTKLSLDPKSGEVVIEFPAENTFAFSAVQKPEVRSLVSESLRNAAGNDVSYRFMQGSTVILQEEAHAPAEAPAQTLATNVPPSAEPAAAPDSPSVKPAAAEVSEPHREAQANPVQTDEIQGARAQTPSSPAPMADVAPEPDLPLLDIYESYDDPSAGAGDFLPSNSQTGKPEPEESPRQVAAPADGEEERLKAQLFQDYGAGVVFEEVEEE